MQVKRYGYIVLGSFALITGCGDDFTTFPDGGGGVPGSGGSGASGGGASGGNASGGNGSGGSGTGAQGTGGMSVGGSGQGGAGATPCNWGGDGNPCGDGFYCDAPDCSTGTCKAVPANHDNAKEVVCGCDDTLYWNSNTAAAHGMPVAKAGRCDDPVGCGNVGGTGQAACKLGLFCGRFVDNGGVCSNNVRGDCWGMPEDCTMIGFGGTFRACPASVSCLYECEAIKADGVYYNDNTCPQ